MRARAAAIDVAPVGDSLYNGLDVGGARIYPFSQGLAIQPPAYYSNYIGSGGGLPITPPVSALEGTSGGNPIGGGASPSDQQAQAHPFGRHSPILWILAAFILTLVVMYVNGYRLKD